MSQVMSCGVVLVNPRHEVFVCRATGRARWDLPKGLQEASESAREAAAREALEEAALRLDAGRLVDLGVFAYLPHKALHLFGLRVAADAFDARACRCRSTFTDPRSGRAVPEVNGYAWQPLDALDAWCGPNLAKVLRAIDFAALRRSPEIGQVMVDVLG